MTEAEFIRSFEALEPQPHFNHVDHVRLGWAYLEQMPLEEAKGRFRASLKAFAGSIGKSQIYHETITMLFMRLIDERKEPGESWPEFQARNSDLLIDGKGLMLRYYRKETLDSAEARAKYLPPDHQP